MKKLLAGLVIAGVAMVGIYAAASTTATAIAANFTPAAATGHLRIVEFASELKRASAEHRAASAKCRLLTGAEKNICNAEAKADEKRAKTAARDTYKGSINLPNVAGSNEPKSARDIDVALYRAQQQLPD
jgi:hypothetical protein